MQPQIAQVGAIRVQVPWDRGILVCQICKSHIGTFDPKEVHLPITADQFGSVDPHHGMWPPFPYLKGREIPKAKTLRCPWCKSFPFLREDILLTPFGYFEPGKDTELPRRRTAEDERQEAIDRAWETEQARHKSLSERNQEEIARQWGAHEAGEATTPEPDRILEEAKRRNPFYRKRGKHKK